MPNVDQQTDYEKIRQQNMLNNEKLLQELMGQSMDLPTGLAAGFAVLGIAEHTPKPKKAAKPKAPKPKATKPKIEKEEPEERVEREGNGTRRSARQASKPSVSFAGDGEGIVDRAKMPRMVSRPDKDWNEDDTDEGEDAEGKVRVNKLVGRIHDPKTFGLIPGVAIGSWWETRAECSAAAIHAPFVAGISGGPEGAYSVALSGGYDDDIDMGDAFTYTGSGGRDLKGTAKNPKNLRTAPQSSHQSFDHSFNKSLKVSSETRKPVRVIRGYKLPGVYAPESGYRYDGLYIVERAWMDRGNNPKGWKVCKFAFRRIPGQPPIPRQGQAPKAAKADVETKDADSEEENEGEDGKSEGEEEAKPKKGSKVGPKSKGKAKVGSKVEVEVEEENEEEEEDGEPVPAKKGNKAGPKSKVKEESEESEDKPKRGRKVGPKSNAKEEEVEEEEEEEEEQEPISTKKGRKVGPKSKIQTEPDEPTSKRGRKPKVQSEPEVNEEEEEEEEDNVPPTKRSKVEEAPKKRGRPAKK
ncbi:SAD/SRA domain protein [Rhizoctonia solani 123E]|uniref:SAD/SRA domain protein n=1 Tax=Rhizoctonia solani 123E TaxID=1423351 RepID=A0A074S939_9AGAM|nr:SAD/SRA domain protein [Rhizoctonia solani 123E]